jgi:hypothetical protein
MAKMDDAKLAALCDGQITDAKRYDGSDLEGNRRLALDFVNGEVDIPSEQGKSSVVSHDLSDTLNWIMPGLLRVFLASDRVAIYEPNKQGAEEFAKQATDYVNYVVLNDCQGYRILQSAFYDGLLMGNGIIKHWWDPTPEYATESFTALTDDVYTQLVADDDVEEVLEHTEYPDPDFSANDAQGAGAPLAINPAMASQLVRPADAGLGGGVGAVPPMAGVPPQVLGAPGAPSASPAGMVGQLSAPASPAGLPAALTALLGGVPALPPPVPMLHDCKIKRKTSSGRLRVEALPPEEFLIHRSAKCLDEETIACGHYYRETRSNLIKQGYAKADVAKIPSGSTADQSVLAQNRDGVWVEEDDNSSDEATEHVDVYEWYPLVDYDGDGIAERRKVVMGGLPSKRTILENVEWGDDLPFSDLVPEPVPHRWRGRSLYDETNDIQRIKTVLLRQTLDNLYQTNNPMTETVENNVLNPDVLINRELGGVVHVKQAGQINTLPVEFSAGQSFGMLTYFDEMLEKRTGVSRSTMALDMGALQNQTATATNAAMSAAATKNETYARNMAEVGMKRLFGCILKLIVKHQDRPRTIRLRGKWVDMDPRAWDANMEVSINTGLGSGSRDRDIAILNGIQGDQEKVLMSLGPNNPLVPLEKYRHTLAKKVEVAGLRDADQFYGDITPEVLQQMQAMAGQQKPDPAMMKAQADIQAAQQKMASDMQLQQAKAQADAQHQQQVAAMKLQTDREKGQLDVQLAREKAAAEIQLTQQRHQAEVELMHRKAEQEFALKQQELQHEAQLKAVQMGMGTNQPSATNIQEAPPQ